jgi:hypothetical protein
MQLFTVVRAHIVTRMPGSPNSWMCEVFYEDGTWTDHLYFDTMYEANQWVIEEYSDWSYKYFHDETGRLTTLINP